MPGSFAEAFPAEFTDDYPRNQIVPQEVFRVFIRRFNKEKRVLVVAVNEEAETCVYTVINSDLNKNAVRPKLRPYHLPLCGDSSSFLEHDSFIDCSRLIETTIGFFVDEILYEKGKPMGRCEDAVFNEVHSTLMTAPSVDRKIKIKYLQ